MKKTLFIIITIIILLLILVCMYISNSNKKLQLIKQVNQEYDVYSNKVVIGTDVTTIINKAIDSNEKNEIPKNEKGIYIENDTNSVRIELIMLAEEGPRTFGMEAIQKAGITGFVKNFNLINFKCSNIEYHEKTKYIKKIVFEQLEQ